MPIDPAHFDAVAAPTTQQRLAFYYQQELSILSAGQEYSIEDRRKMNAELSEIRTAIKELEAELATDDSTFGDGFGLIEFGQD